MTDTTDIKALRAETWGLHTMQDATEFSDRLLDLLEAERQRADANEPVRCEGVPQHVHDMIDLQETIDELRAEIAALKGDQVPVAIDADIIRDANRYRFLRDEDAWGEDSDSWDVETRTGLISSENLMGGLSPDHFDAAIDARIAASDIPFLNPVTDPQKPVVLPIDEMSYKDACEFVSINGMRNEDRPTLAMRAWNSCRKAAIEDAGGIVKDGE